MRQRKYAIFVFGIFMTIEGLLGLYGNFSSSLPVAFKVFNIILLSVIITTGFFLIKFRKWARLVALAFAAVFISLYIMRAFYTYFHSSILDNCLWQKIFNLSSTSHFTVLVLMVYYLTRPKIKEIFT